MSGGSDLAYHRAVPAREWEGRSVSIRAEQSPYRRGAQYVATGRSKDPNSIQSYFTGKEVVLKIDMPGTQQGVDLRYNKDNPMNWKEYANRLKSNGVAIHKGDTARVTAVVVKDDRIEFQLDGGGFGTFVDDSSTTVTPKTVDKSDYEKQLEREIANTTDEDRKRQLQRDLDRERSRRERQEADNRDAAQVASQIKAQKIADKRLQGGSRFNLRWSGSIPADQKNPDAVMKLLADYVSFDGPQQAAAPPARCTNAAGDAAVPATAQLKRGMKMERRHKPVRTRKAVIGICFRRWLENTNGSIRERRSACRSDVMSKGLVVAVLHQLQLSL